LFNPKYGIIFGMWSFRLPHHDHYMLKLCSSQPNLHPLAFTKNQEYQCPQNLFAKSTTL